LTLAQETNWRIRMSSCGDGTSKVFVRKSDFVVGQPISFDLDYPSVTALEHLLAAIGGDLVNGFGDLARRRRVEVEHVEASIEASLHNPLAYLSVLGEEGHCGLAKLCIRVFVSSLAEEDCLEELWQRTLERSPLLSTLHPRIEIDLHFKVVF
jgi:OsmC-like protein